MGISRLERSRGGLRIGIRRKILIETKGCRVTGIEVDPHAAREARGNGLTVVEGSLEDPQFGASVNERFDFVLATDVLEHMRDPAVVLDDFKRWLSPAGARDHCRAERRDVANP